MDIIAIKKYMRENKISQIELAEKSKIPLQTIRKILSGVTPNPRIDTVDAINKALGLEKEKTPTQLSEGEEKLLEAFRQVPQEQQDLVLSMVKVALESLKNN